MRRAAAIGVMMLATHCVHGRTLEEIVADLRVANDRQQTELNDAKSRLNWTWNELGNAQAQIRLVAEERDSWKAYGDAQHDKFMNAEKRVAECKAGLLRRDLIIGALVAAIGVWAFLKFYLRVPFI